MATSRPKEQRVKKARPQASKGKGREKGKGVGPGRQPSSWILFFAVPVVIVLIAAVAAWVMATGGGGGDQPPAKSYAIQGTQHIQEGESHPPYNSNPPTSGWHYQRDASWGVHEAEIPDEQAVHNLEHGGIWISYQPTLDQASADKLREIARRYRSKVILTPRARDDSKIALAAWGKLDALESLDEGRIVTFIKSFINQGPEKVPD